MSDRVEKRQGGRKPIYLRGTNSQFDATTPPNRGLRLRGMSGRSEEFDEEQSPLTLRQPSRSTHTPPTPRNSNFNPEAAPFTPTVSAFVNTPDSSPADPQSVEKSLKEKRAERLRQINAIEDSRDREDAMNDFIWEQHTEWSAEDLAREKEEKELEERRQKFGRRHKDSPRK
ncbi:hypothetical protein FPOAC2_03724 [Fusarium poae]|jgi:hypothetical protein|uniref:hypothetical protein n=1 Tax=Fusarium poae TaxID=36050 RepID=UPI001CE8DEE1|nr:hypothetical protein FPOAC1_003614 [Fusarium poae]KAG8677590.1 hypothetical protein FPOAC1_003614 [Fusarium poae]